MLLVHFLCTTLVCTVVSAGHWSEWEDYGPCIPGHPNKRKSDLLADPQDGRQSRRRVCLKNEDEDEAEDVLYDDADDNKNKCDTAGKVQRMIRFCRIDTGWSPWSEPGECSEKCGPGFKSQERSCVLSKGTVLEAGQNSTCVFGAVEQQKTNCTVKPCPVNGGWSLWSNTRCGSSHCTFEQKTDVQGVLYQVRTCSNPFPRYGGSVCQGPFLRNFTCFEPLNCPENGGWSAWSDWTCQSDYLVRRKSCDNPPPRNGGIYCKGHNEQVITESDNSQLFRDTCGHSGEQSTEAPEEETEIPAESEEGGEDWENQDI